MCTTKKFASDKRSRLFCRSISHFLQLVLCKRFADFVLKMRTKTQASVLGWCDDTRLNDTQYNDTQPKDTQHNGTQPKDTQHNGLNWNTEEFFYYYAECFRLSFNVLCIITLSIVMLSVTLLSLIVLSAVAPWGRYKNWRHGTHHNDTQHNDTNNKTTRHSAYFDTVMLTIVMLSSVYAECLP